MQPPESREQPLDRSNLNNDGENSDTFGRMDASFSPEDTEFVDDDGSGDPAAPYTREVPYQPMALQTAPDYESGQAASGFRVKLSDAVHVEDGLEDAAILAFEYDRRRMEWWKWRRFGVIGLPSLAILFFLIAVLTGLMGPGYAAVNSLCVSVGLILLIVTILFIMYTAFTKPQVMSFGRAYRRLVSLPLTEGGVVWCDAAVPAPNFQDLRDSFFTLYQESHGVGAGGEVSQPGEIDGKKKTLQDLKGMLKPIRVDPNAPSPFIPRDEASLLDRVRLEPLSWQDLNNLNNHTLPVPMQHLNTPFELQHLTQGIEGYIGMRSEPVSVQLGSAGDVAVSAPLHSQITSRMDANFSKVGGEIEKWRARAGREKPFYAGVVEQYKAAADVASLNYDQTTLRLEEEVQPAITQLDSDLAFYHQTIEEHYQALRVDVEKERDAALDELNQERRALESVIDDRTDEHALLSAELKSFREQSVRLENSTNQRFEGLKQQLDELTRRTYSVPNPPHFRSDYAVEPSAITTEDCLQQLAELRAETRLATSAANNALTRFARLQFEPLDELSQLETRIRASNKWQATSYLGDLVNFKQSGQLLALAGEVSEAASVYLDTAADFDRLNRRWCELEVSIRNLGLAGYANRLQEAQEYLLSLSRVAGSLHSSLLSGGHSPEMARPATFQNIYDLAAGLDRELNELTSLAGSITFSEERLGDLAEELEQLNQKYNGNTGAIEQVQTDASVKLYQWNQKQKQILEKMETLKAERLANIRGHIDALAAEKKTLLKIHKSGEADLNEIPYATERLLMTHITGAERLLREARQLHKGLEATISGIVTEFEASIIPDRIVTTGSELLIPVWYFQFRERKLFTPTIFGFATCYTQLELDSTVGLAGADTSSLWRFFTSTHPAVRYQIADEPALATLIGAQNLDYPAGQIQVSNTQVDKLVTEGWVNRWLARFLKGAYKHT